jgi:hypothetical protein
MFRKTKEISKYDRPIQDLENPEDEVQTRRGQDECGTMKDEPKKGGSQKKE